MLAVRVVGTDRMSRATHAVLPHVSGSNVSASSVGSTVERPHRVDTSVYVFVPVANKEPDSEEEGRTST